MLTTQECPEMNVGTGKFSDDVEMTVELKLGSTPVTLPLFSLLPSPFLLTSFFLLYPPYLLPTLLFPFPSLSPLLFPSPHS